MARYRLRLIGTRGGKDFEDIWSACQSLPHFADRSLPMSLEATNRALAPFGLELVDVPPECSLCGEIEGLVTYCAGCSDALLRESEPNQSFAHEPIVREVVREIHVMPALEDV